MCAHACVCVQTDIPLFYQLPPIYFWLKQHLKLERIGRTEEWKEALEKQKLCWKVLQGHKSNTKENTCFSNLYYFYTLILKHHICLPLFFSLVVLIFFYFVHGALNINETCRIFDVCMYIKVEESVEGYFQQEEELHKFINPNWLVVLFWEIFNEVV